jgi:putative protease
MRKIELLAPAGNFECLEAAVNAGADAVYLGGTNFGARAFAGNFDHEELQRALLFAHRHGVRIYVTVNTLFDDSETKALADELVFLNNAGADGLIVQDLGVIRLARQLIPQMPLHASTQMTITNSPGVRFAAGAGMCRVVPARELSLGAWKAVSSQGTEIEAFIHGALCVCYSGQCLMSSMIGGRSGNRGCCAQPCRMPYALAGTEKGQMHSRAEQYLLSPKDLNTLAILPELFETGITSYKIEGRMKRPEYVAVVTDVYRRAFDSWLNGRFSVPESDYDRLEQIFNRGFTTAYLHGHPGRTMMSVERPDNHGVRVGKVVNAANGRAVIALEKTLNCGDGLEFISGRNSCGTVVKSIKAGGRKVMSALASSQAEIAVPPKVRQGAAVFRTLDRKLMDDAACFLGSRGKRRIPVDARVTATAGSPLEVTFTDSAGRCGHAVTKINAEPAHNCPLSEKSLREQLGRLGTTEYVLGRLDLHIDGNLMVPASELNEARRTAIAELDAARLKAFAPARMPVTKEQLIRVLDDDAAERKSRVKAARTSVSSLSVWTDAADKLRAALEGGADLIIFGGDRFASKDVSFSDYAQAVQRVRRAGKKIAFATPRIVSEEQLEWCRRFLTDAENVHPDLICVHNIGVWQMARELELKTPLWADMSLNIANTQSLTFWAEHGAAGITPSIELSLAQVRSLALHSPLPIECLVMGRIEMMVSEYCAPGSFIGGLDKGACSFRCGRQLYLQDRTGAMFPLAGDQFCRMHVLNSTDLCVLDMIPRLMERGIRLRIDARTYSAEQTRKMTQLCRDAMQGRPVKNLPGTTRGHYSRGAV